MEAAETVHGSGDASAVGESSVPSAVDFDQAEAPAADVSHGERRAVAVDVARAAGVSQKTVSRVVNGDAHVSDEVRQRVEAAIAELGYRPNSAARALVTQRTRVLGVVTPGSSMYGPSAQLLGIERAAWSAGYSVVIASTAEASGGELAAAIDRLLDHGVDGIVLVGPLTTDELPHGALRGVPAITVGDPLVGKIVCPTVMADQHDGAWQATDHLLGCGHESVFHVSGPTSWYSAQTRIDGWRSALAEAGAPVPEPLVGDWTARSGYEAGRILAADDAVTAVFAANDQMAIGVMRAFAEAGRSVPADVSVVGFDDSPESEFLLVPLTTVRQNFDVVTRRAVRQLVAILAGEMRTPEVTRIPVELIVRSSTGAVPRR